MRYVGLIACAVLFFGWSGANALPPSNAPAPPPANNATNSVTQPSAPGDTAAATNNAGADATTQAGDKAPSTADKPAADRGTVQPSTKNPLTDAGLTAKSLRALMILFVLAVVQESALALLFNWRPFLMTFDGRGVRSVISLGASLLLVFGFQIDIIAKLMADYAGQAQTTFFGQVLTAMVIAGGSSGVNNMLKALGVRSEDPSKAAPKPDPNEAWLSVAVTERKIVSADFPVWVEIQEDQGPYEVAGVITGVSKPANLLSMFLRDPGKLPQTGGIVCKPGSTYLVRVSGRKSDGATYVSQSWGPGVLRDRAIVDLQFKA